ncbi:prolyl aminopeptidase [Gluconacetobacter azotocaptans]|uniref:prolyl aminopeptidase n=1 Tax=Gluconacetobacter azotocaptans TaxID=142834 RepID=UPI00195D59B5|nr:prolyl aminopeptidase [Gluconacetobacter azotocaptans]MBM9402335.1 prolyl aminopeptidase [Gluconacetobacter azotocaptans]
MPRHDLFPDIAPYESGYLSVGDGHEVYWEQAGNPRGRPVLFLHGGPGAGAGAVHRRFFDPAFWRVILFDQRGAGRSRPHASVTANTTPHLVGDIETLRRFLGIDDWMLFGGSWGSTLALMYAQTYPQRVRAMVLRGIFLGRARELDWFFHGLANVFPDAHDAFLSHLPVHDRHDPLAAYMRLLFDPDPHVHLPAARAWSAYEGTCSTLIPAPAAVAGFAHDRAVVGLARIEAHYFRHGLFLPPEGLLAGMSRIAHIPGRIVQGRYDMVCPSQSAWELARHWPQASLAMVPDAGHSALEPGIRRRLVTCVEELRDT